MPTLSLTRITSETIEDELCTHVEARKLSLDRLVAMRRQEALYRLGHRCAKNKTLLHLSMNSAFSNCRIAMCDWCYKLVDVCGLSRENVAAGISYVDRYLTTKQGRRVLQNISDYKLLIVSALYLAIKLNEPLKIDVSIFVKLSGGSYSKEDIEATERSILFALDWKINGPTSLTFLRYLMTLMSDSVDIQVKKIIWVGARHMTELAATESSFARHMPSQIAVAAMVNAMNEVNRNLLPTEVQMRFLNDIETRLGLTLDDQVQMIMGNLDLLLVGVSPFCNYSAKVTSLNKPPNSQSISPVASQEFVQTLI